MPRILQAGVEQDGNPGALCQAGIAQPWPQPLFHPLVDPVEHHGGRDLAWPVILPLLLLGPGGGLQRVPLLQRGRIDDRLEGDPGILRQRSPVAPSIETGDEAVPVGHGPFQLFAPAAMLRLFLSQPQLGERRFQKTQHRPAAGAAHQQDRHRIALSGQAAQRRQLLRPVSGLRPGARIAHCGLARDQQRPARPRAARSLYRRHRLRHGDHVEAPPAPASLQPVRCRIPHSPARPAGEAQETGAFADRGRRESPGGGV